MLLFVLAIPFAIAQEPAAKFADSGDSEWKTVLEVGTLQPNPDIVSVEGGIAVAATSFVDPIWRFGSPWVLYDPVTGRWSEHEISPVESSLMDVEKELLERLDIVDLIPDAPGIKYQYVAGGKKLAFLIPDDELFDEFSFYSSVRIVDPATKSVESRYVWFCQGPPDAKLNVWDFPDQKMSVICNIVISHEGADSRLRDTHDFIGKNLPAAFQLISHSPDHRFWIFREADFYHDEIGDFWVYDRRTELTTMMLWSRAHKPQRDFVLWLDNASLLTNVGEYILYLDMVQRTRHELLREELAKLQGDMAFVNSTLSTDGWWLLVAKADGSLHLRNVTDALPEVSEYREDRSVEK